MSKAGSALKQVLEAHGITQYQLAARMGINRSNFSRWLRGERDPLSDVVVDMYWALKTLNPNSAQQFIQLYLGLPQEDAAAAVQPAPATETMLEPDVDSTLVPQPESDRSIHY
jgi:transcriptional regulator with XRE-family HTH domain